jgi:hypothetical protein
MKGGGTTGTSDGARAKAWCHLTQAEASPRSTVLGIWLRERVARPDLRGGLDDVREDVREARGDEHPAGERVQEAHHPIRVRRPPGAPQQRHARVRYMNL